MKNFVDGDTVKCTNGENTIVLIYRSNSMGEWGG